jgi:ABC-type transport system involved in multi-copper enzyme maturation permease subunit
VFVRISTAIPTDNSFGQTFAGVVMMLYSLAAFAVMVMSFVLMIWRFHKNYMSDEGYLMFTLPVNTAQLIWSKLIVAIGWFLCSLVVAGLANLIISIGSDMMQGFSMDSLQQLEEMGFDFKQMRSLVLSGALALLVGGVCLCLMFYASMSVGQSFRSHKTLMSVITFFVFYIVSQVVTVRLLSGVFDNVEVFMFGMNDFSSVMPVITGLLRRSIIAEVIGVVVYYVITHFMLAKRLNLQ